MRRVRRALLSLLGVALLAIGSGLLVGCCVLSAPTHRGAPGAHFDGERFFDDKPRVERGGDVLKWMVGRRPEPWPEWIDAAPGPKPAARIDDLRVTVVNHATVLVQLQGANILTDPIWAERASPFSFVGPKRVRPPGVRFEDLPPIDAVVLSHNHYDHMNVETLLRLRDAHRPLFIAGLGNELFLSEQGIETRAVDWGDVVEVNGVRIHAVPSQHFSNRGLCDRDGTLWTAYVFEGDHAGSAYFAGDTGYGAHFKAVGARFPGIRVALLPIGAYRPVWFMGPVHTTPGEAVQAQLDLGARVGVAIHYATFHLADEGYHDPERDLLTALDHKKERPDFRALAFGQPFDVP